MRKQTTTAFWQGIRFRKGKIKIKRVSLFLLLLYTAALSSCKSIPKDVQDDIDTYETRPTDEQADQNTTDYDTLDNIIANTPENMNTKIGNVLFDGIIRVPETDSLSELTLIYNSAFYKHRRELYQYFLPIGDLLDEQLIVDVINRNIKAGILDSTKEYLGVEYYENDHHLISIGEDGFLVSVPLTEEKNEENPTGDFAPTFYPVEEIIHCYRGEPLSDDPRPVRGGELSLKQAAQEVLNFLNTDPWKQWEEGYMYMIRTAFVRKVGCYRRA